MTPYDDTVTAIKELNRKILLLMDADSMADCPERTMILLSITVPQLITDASSTFLRTGIWLTDIGDGADFYLASRAVSHLKQAKTYTRDAIAALNERDHRLATHDVQMSIDFLKRFHTTYLLAQNATNP